MTVTTEKMREGQILSLGQNLDWRQQDNSEGVPGLTGEGVKIGRRSVVAAYAIQPRKELHRKTTVLKVDEVESGTYEVIVNNNTVDITVAGSEEPHHVASALEGAINADPGMSDVVSATHEPSDDVYVTLKGVEFDSYDVSVSSPSADALVIDHEDADSCDFRIYLRPPTGDTNSAWNLVNDGLGSANVRGLTDRLVTAGYDQMYIETYNVEPAGTDVTIFIAPAQV